MTMEAIVAAATPIITKVLYTGAGAAVVTAIILRIIPNEKLSAACFAAGKMVSSFGRSKWGKPFWEPIESFFENSIGVALNAFLKGMSDDDSK
jgi:hypothetical protein